MEEGWLKHVDAFPEMRYLRDFSNYIITAQGLEMGRLLGIEQPGPGALVARVFKRLKACFQSAT